MQSFMNADFQKELGLFSQMAASGKKELQGWKAPARHHLTTRFFGSHLKKVKANEVRQYVETVFKEGKRVTVNV